MAYVVQEPNTPQEHAQPVHCSGARVQDHDPGTSQPETRRRDSQQGSQEMLENATLVAPFGKEDTATESQSYAAHTQDTLVNAVENAEVTEIKRAVRIDTSQSCRDEGIRHDCPTWNADHQREQRDLPTRNRVTRVQDSSATVVHDEEERQGCQECWCDFRGSTSR